MGYLLNLQFSDCTLIYDCTYKYISAYAAQLLTININLTTSYWLYANIRLAIVMLLLILSNYLKCKIVETEVTLNIQVRY